MSVKSCIGAKYGATGTPQALAVIVRATSCSRQGGVGRRGEGRGECYCQPTDALYATWFKLISHALVVVFCKILNVDQGSNYLRILYIFKHGIQVQLS